MKKKTSYILIGANQLLFSSSCIFFSLLLYYPLYPSYSLRLQDLLKYKPHNHVVNSLKHDCPFSIAVSFSTYMAQVYRSKH